jgi:flagellar biosynthesis/type III secretory pathway M-ring protein FliF/YscJ
VCGRHTNRGGVEVVKEEKRRREVKEKKFVKERIKEDKATRKMNCGQDNKQKKTPMGALENLAEKKEEQVGKVLKVWVMWT